MNTQNPPIKTATEDILNLSAAVVDPITGNQEIADCSRYLRINGNPLQDVSTPIDFIRHDAFKLLYNKAKSLHLNGKYVTGLKIHFGVDASTDKICVFYQPVCLESGKDVGAKLRQYNVKEGGWYGYDSINNMFIPKNQSHAMPFLNTHKNRISILRTDSDNAHTRFIPDSDVEAVIFPFQEIMAVIKDNPNDTHVGLFNSIRKEEVIKHAILLKSGKDNSQISARALADTSSGDGFNEKYANLANLCPPNGETVTCTLE